MIVGYGNYVYTHGKKKSKIFLIRPSYNSKSSTGYIGMNDLHFPEHCIGKRVRVKVEFIEEDKKSFDKNRNLVEDLKFEDVK